MILQSHPYFVTLHHTYFLRCSTNFPTACHVSVRNFINAESILLPTQQGGTATTSYNKHHVFVTVTRKGLKQCNVKTCNYTYTRRDCVHISYTRLTSFHFRSLKHILLGIDCSGIICLGCVVNDLLQCCPFLVWC